MIILNSTNCGAVFSKFLGIFMKFCVFLILVFGIFLNAIRKRETHFVIICAHSVAHSEGVFSTIGLKQFGTFLFLFFKERFMFFVCNECEICCSFFI